MNFIADPERLKTIHNDHLRTLVKIMKVNSLLPGRPSMQDQLRKAVDEENYELATLIKAEIEAEEKGSC